MSSIMTAITATTDMTITAATMTATAIKRLWVIVPPSKGEFMYSNSSPGPVPAIARAVASLVNAARKAVSVTEVVDYVSERVRDLTVRTPGPRASAE
jgi:hypothetical protein